MSSFKLFAADEHLYKVLDQFKSESLVDKRQKRPKVQVKTSYYEVDLNQDSQPEYAQAHKIDGIDYFILKDSFKRTLLKKKLDTNGDNSYLYKMQLKRISKDINILILYFDQGSVDAYNFTKSAKLYFITIENSKINDLHFYSGPSFFYEYQTKHNNYINRKYSVSLFDYDSDGKKELSVKYKSITKIYFYQGDGVWKTY
jgi:hypothetical protein